MPATATRPETPKSATAVMITPHLVCRDAASAIEFYKRALGADEMRVIRAPGGGVMHAAMTLGENGSAMFFLADECPEFGNRSPLGLGGTPVTMHVHVKDCDAFFERAITAGCTVRMPLQNMFWGDRYGVLSDPYGHTWSVATNVEQVSDDEMQRRAAACAGEMQKQIEARRAAGH